MPGVREKALIRKHFAAINDTRARKASLGRAALWQLPFFFSLLRSNSSSQYNRATGSSSWDLLCGTRGACLARARAFIEIITARRCWFWEPRGSCLCDLKTHFKYLTAGLEAMLLAAITGESSECVQFGRIGFVESDRWWIVVTVNFCRPDVFEWRLHFWRRAHHRRTSVKIKSFLNWRAFFDWSCDNFFCHCETF